MEFVCDSQVHGRTFCPDASVLDRLGSSRTSVTLGATAVNVRQHAGNFSLQEHLMTSEPRRKRTSDGGDRSVGQRSGKDVPHKRCFVHFT